ncbi:MAG: FtsZ-binding cell division protein ZapB [Patiriisocius sp.]|jgi:FtsZ-binding cell division protein ZapB
MKRELQSRINTIYNAKVLLLNNQSMAIAELKKKNQLQQSVNQVNNRKDFLDMTNQLDNWASEFPVVQG